MSARQKSRRFSNLLIPLFALVAIVTLLLFGRAGIGFWARSKATEQLETGAISTAMDWLVWSKWFAGNDGRTDLLLARCFRHLKQEGQFVEAIEAAKKNGASTAQIRQEVRLSEIQSGKLADAAEEELLDLVTAGVSAHEVSAAFVYGYLYRNEPQKAKRILDAWSADFPGTAHVGYMSGVYSRSVDDPTRAETEFQNALAKQPTYELARLSLAELYEEQNECIRSLEQFIDLANRFPANEAARLGVARLLRKTGRTAEARGVLLPRAAQQNSTLDMQLEMSEIEFESGNYEEARSWLKRARLDQPPDYDALLQRATTFAVQGYTSSAEPFFLRARGAATMMALAGDVSHANWLFGRVDENYRRLRRIHDVRVRLGIEPNNAQLIDELQRLHEQANGASNAGEQWKKDRSDTRDGRQLYLFHCAVCHGATGDGNGLAARHLFPRPRDFGTQRFRLVSTVNALPSHDDLHRVIQRGMPGTSMPSFAKLNETQRQALVEEVLRLQREGVREHMTKLLRDESGIVAADELDELVQNHTTPGDSVQIPQIGASDSQAIARGEESFLKLGCHQCHHPGSPVDFLFDDQGRPTKARDLAYDPFKGGHEPESIYLRLRLGMPGTAHPASANLLDSDLVDLVQYCRSISREPKRSLTNHQRRLGMRQE